MLSVITPRFLFKKAGTNEVDDRNAGYENDAGSIVPEIALRKFRMNRV